MLTIKIILLVLSLFQYMTQASFWQADFYWLFVWVIAFQILWFYLENQTYKKLMIGMLGALALINSLVLPSLPLMMLGLYMIDVREQFKRPTSLLIAGGLLLGLVGIWTFITQWPAGNTLFLLAGIIALSVLSAKQRLEIKQRNAERYQQLLAQNELEDKTDLLKAQMSSMEEVYKLNERNRISRDLHDSIGHTLSTIVIQLAAIEKLTEDSNPKASNMLGQLHQFTKKGLGNVREVIHEIKPSHYNRIAFVEQLDHLIKEFEANSQIHVYFNTNEMQWALNEDQESLIYRGVQEFLGNTSKHSQATEIRIQYHFTDSSVILTMQDNGEGTDEVDPQMGLGGMQERAELLGGKVNIQSQSGSGFKVRIVLPKGGFADGADTD